MTNHGTKLFSVVALLAGFLLVWPATVMAHAPGLQQAEQESVDLGTRVPSLYNEGKYAEIAEVVHEAGGICSSMEPETLYLVALAYEELDRDADARKAYAKITGEDEQPARKRGSKKKGKNKKKAKEPAAESTGEGEQDPWVGIGRSADLASRGDLDGALEAARAAVEAAPGNPMVHYQHGRVLTAQEKHTAASEAFVDVLELRGDFAYAHYWAGMNYYQTGNLVAASNHLTRFLQLAPEAPEKLQVQGILATIQG